MWPTSSALRPCPSCRIEPDKYIVKTVLELQSETIEPIVPYSDPALTESPALMLRLIRLLHSNGLISFRRRARSFVGAFAVHMARRAASGSAL